jgi:SAM-dependent methyltransferase
MNVSMALRAGIEAQRINIEAMLVNIESLQSSAAELHEASQRHDAGKIRALVRIAEIHERPEPAEYPPAIQLASYPGLMTAPQFRKDRRGRLCYLVLGLVAALSLFGADRSFAPYASVKGFLPAELRIADEAQWQAWCQRQDMAIRARLEQGDLESMANLLLLGTSFTKQPRVPMDRITEASKAGSLRARVDDLVAGLRHPGGNERLLFLQGLLRRQGIDPEDPRQPGVFLYNNLLRVVKERISLGQRVAEAEELKRPEDPASLLNRSSVYRDRGVSLDTGILPDFLIEQTLRGLKKQGVLREGQVARVAVVGPGLDFIDKNEEYAYDYYPQQTLQPFALYDSLVRLGLAKSNSLTLSILDISSRVIDHMQRARERAVKNAGYVVQLPRDVSRPWQAEQIAYWKSLGDQVGTVVAPIRPPEIFQGLETRAVRIRPEVVRACEPVDLDIVVEHLNLPAEERFDLIVGTNIFVYYDAFQQALALENAGVMLKPGGLLLSNDRLPEASGGSMRLAGITVVSYDVPGAGTPLAVGWYRKE